MQKTEIQVPAPDMEVARLLLGTNDETRRLIEKELPVTMQLRDGQFFIAGDEIEAQKAAHLISELLEVATQSRRGGRAFSAADVRYLVRQSKGGQGVAEVKKMLSDTLVTTERGKPIGPRTSGQKEYVDALRNAEMCFAIGPAGTGKTYLAVAAAVAALKEKKVARIILTRPAVEAGERLGFLPGDLEAKIDPYLRPLYDALYDLLDLEKAQKLFERKVIEIAPLAYMRGRTLNDAFVILDEAQNATGAQMKMFLTRLGFGSRMVVTGDITQTDLPRGEESGLKAAARILPGVKGIEFVYLGAADVVRHNLVQRVIEAYDKNENPERF
ncbi:MAG TPA: PhoH family protein [Abditibacterium sp.]